MHELTPSKGSAQCEAEGIQFMRHQKIASYSIAKLTAAVIAGYRDYRLKTVGAGTIIRELSILSGIITHARKGCNLPTTNLCVLVRGPQLHWGEPDFLLRAKRRGCLMNSKLFGVEILEWSY